MTADYSYTVTGTTGGTAAGNSTDFNDNVTWKVHDGVSWTDPNKERIEALEKILVILADIIECNPHADIKLFLKAVDKFREKGEEEEIVDHIDPKLFEIIDDF